MLEAQLSYPYTPTMSERDSYPTKEDIKHIEEMSRTERDTTASSSDAYVYPSHAQKSGRFAGLRYVVTL